MIRLAMILAVVLMAGCAGMNDGSYMPSEKQLTWKNPMLLNCPAGSIATCNTRGGLIKKSYENCTCRRGGFGQIR